MKIFLSAPHAIAVAGFLFGAWQYTKIESSEQTAWPEKLLMTALMMTCIVVVLMCFKWGINGRAVYFKDSQKKE